jgi:hypothetical protein
MEATLDVVESNLRTLETDGVEDAELADAEPHLRGARDAIAAHNDAVLALDTNLTILDAYLA